jgi:hypothetical protein
MVGIHGGAPTQLGFYPSCTEIALAETEQISHHPVVTPGLANRLASACALLTGARLRFWTLLLVPVCPPPPGAVNHLCTHLPQVDCGVHLFVVQARAMNARDTIPPTSLRLPLDLKAKLAVRAKDNRRSVSQEVIVAIEHYLATVPEPKHKLRK